MTERQSTWERLALGIAQIVIAGMLIALYTKVDEVVVAVAVVQSQVADIRASEEGYYTRREAEVRHESIFETNTHQYSLIEDHEGRLRKLETHE